jgi:hypothetical protein
MLSTPTICPSPALTTNWCFCPESSSMFSIVPMYEFTERIML